MALLAATGGAGAAQPTLFEQVNQQLDRGGRPEPKIINGEGVSISDHPWQVSLVAARAPSAFQGHFCGGAIVHADWVITAAHCVDGVRSADQLHVVSGDSSLHSARQRSRVAQIVVHPRWDRERLRHDIALLRIDRSGPPLRGEPVAGPSADATMMLRFLPIRVTGWGVSTRADSSTPQLQGVALPYGERPAAPP